MTIFVTKRKTLMAVIAASLAVVIMLGGTFAWQSINQTALNEVYASRNPGGRLHDDFNDITEATGATTMTFDKNVYVENFTTLAENGVQIFARIRLDEYMELGDRAGELTADGLAPSADNKAVSLISGAKLADKNTWTTHIPGNTEDPFHEYWDWDADGGVATYMPTFNKNRDSLEADVNGTFDNNFNDYIDYTAEANKSKDGVAVYDSDDDIDDEIVLNNWDATTAESHGHVRTENETHEAKQTLDSVVITMEVYKELLADDNPYNDTGDFWVWDADGWAYWANPINPDTATGLLLDGISRTETVINEDWYYAINVVAQFITKKDMGQYNNTGFYDTSKGVAPSEDALVLLSTIGVDVTFEVSNAEELKAALAHGGDIVVTDNITVDTNLVVGKDTTLDLGENVISNTTEMYNTDDGIWSLISVQNGSTLIIDGGTFDALDNDCFAVDVRDGSKLVINSGSFTGNISAVYVHSGVAYINGGSFSVVQLPDDGMNDELLNAYDANYADGTAKIIVRGGTFQGFDPSQTNDGSYVDAAYIVTFDSTANTYTVSR